jgi:hypothetical protein
MDMENEMTDTSYIGAALWAITFVQVIWSLTITHSMMTKPWSRKYAAKMFSVIFIMGCVGIIHFQQMMESN